MTLKTKYLFNTIVFLMLMALNPGYSPGWIGEFFSILRVAAFIYSCFLVIWGKIYKNTYFWAVISILILMGISTFLYSGNISGYAFAFRQFFSMAVISFYCLEKKPRFYIRSQAVIFSFLLFMDGLTWRAEGLYQLLGRKYFFLNTATTITYYIFIGLAFDFLYIRMTSGKERWFAYIITALAAGSSCWYVFNQKVSTAAFCLVLLPLMLYFIYKTKAVGNAIVNYGFFATFILNMLIVFFESSVGLFSGIFSILGENTELHGRRQIWQMVIDCIIKRPIQGYGYASDIRFDVWQPYNTSTHNFYLYLLFSMGILGLLLYLGVIFYLHRKQKRFHMTVTSKILLVTLIIMNMVSISESSNFRVMYFALLSAMANIEYIIPLTEKKYLYGDKRWRFQTKR